MQSGLLQQNWRSVIGFRCNGPFRENQLSKAMQFVHLIWDFYCCEGISHFHQLSGFILISIATSLFTTEEDRRFILSALGLHTPELEHMFWSSCAMFKWRRYSECGTRMSDLIRHNRGSSFLLSFHERMPMELSISFWFLPQFSSIRLTASVRVSGSISFDCFSSLPSLIIGKACGQVIDLSALSSFAFAQSQFDTKTCYCAISVLLSQLSCLNTSHLSLMRIWHLISINSGFMLARGTVSIQLEHVCVTWALLNIHWAHRNLSKSFVTLFMPFFWAFNL